MKEVVDMVEALRYKYNLDNTVISESFLRRNNPSIACHMCRGAVFANTISVVNQGTENNLD